MAIVIILLLYVVFQQINFQKDDFFDNYEEELLAQGYEKIDEGFYGMIIGQEQNKTNILKEIYTEQDLEVAKKIIKKEEFKDEIPIKIKKLEGEKLENLKKENPNIYDEARNGNYEVRFPSYLAIYDFEEDEVIKWYYFQIIDISGG